MATKGSFNDSIASNLRHGSESVFDYVCNECELDGKYVEAVLFCSDCKINICQKCYNVHQARRHTLSGECQVPHITPRQRQQQDSCSEPCETHKNETLKYYCTDHDELGCGVCTAMCHPNCSGVEFIPYIARKVIKSKEYRAMSLKVKSLIKRTQNTITKTQRKTKKSNQNYSYASEFFSQLKKDLVAAVDQLEEILMEEAETIRNDNRNRMKSVEIQCQELLESMKTLDSNFNSLEKQQQFSQLFCSIKRARDELVYFESDLDVLQTQINITECVFKLSDDVQNMIKQPLDIAWLEVNRGKQNTPSQPMTEAVYVDDIGVLSSDDTRSTYISGMVVLPDDKLLAVDHDNDKVKYLDLQRNKLVSQFKHTSALWDIAAVNNTRIAVTCPKNKTILFIDVSNKLKLEREVNVSGACWGIACVDDKLAVTFDEPIKVEIINKKGKLLHTIVPEEIGKQLFTNPWHLAISPDQQLLYISDWNTATLTCVDRNGAVKATYKDDDLSDPQGLTVDKTGLVYVCGHWSNNIHQLSPDLNKHQDLLKKADGIEGPVSVSYSVEQNKVYIGLDGGDIKVYQLSLSNPDQ